MATFLQYALSIKGCLIIFIIVLFIINIINWYKSIFTINKEAFSKNMYMKVMSYNIDFIEKNNTWNLVKLLNKRKCMRSKWLYKSKYKSKCKIERYKARILAKGFIKWYGIDCK